LRTPNPDALYLEHHEAAISLACKLGLTPKQGEKALRVAAHKYAKAINLSSPVSGVPPPSAGCHVLMEMARQVLNHRQERLFEEHGRVVVLFATTKTGCTVADALDALHEVFIKACNTFRASKGTTFRTWLIRLVINELRSLRRKQRRETPLEDESATDQVAHGRVDETPETIMARSERQEKIKEALAMIEKECQVHWTMLRRIYVDGESWEKVDPVSAGAAVRAKLSKLRNDLRLGKKPWHRLVRELLHPNDPGNENGAM
jgi:RNA polymerase sigma factor (sigma-70 family)